MQIKTPHMAEQSSKSLTETDKLSWISSLGYLWKGCSFYFRAIHIASEISLSFLRREQEKILTTNRNNTWQYEALVGRQKNIGPRSFKHSPFPENILATIATKTCRSHDQTTSKQPLQFQRLNSEGKIL